MKYSPTLLLCCLSLAGLVRAQNPDKIDQKRGKGDVPDAGVTEEGMADEKAQKLAAGEAGEVNGKGRPAGRTDLPRFCDFMGSARPSPIPPGGSGTFNIIAILKGDGVITDASGVKLDYQRQQGPLTLGEPIWPVARPGKLAAAFQGRPVFEDTMVVSIPVTVAAGTAFGNFAVQANVAANLSQGSNAAVLGEMKTLVNAAVSVGPASVALGVPDRTSGQQATGEPPQPAEDHGKPPTKPETTGKGTAVSGMQAKGQALTPSTGESTSGPDPDLAAPVDGPRPPEKDGPPMLLMVGGGFVVLLLVVLMLAKKK